MIDNLYEENNVCDDEFDDDTKYVLTPKAIMALVLEDYGIKVSFRMAKAICDDFMEIMERSGHLQYIEEDDITSL